MRFELTAACYFIYLKVPAETEIKESSNELQLYFVTVHILKLLASITSQALIHGTKREMQLTNQIPFVIDDEVTQVSSIIIFQLQINL